MPQILTYNPGSYLRSWTGMVHDWHGLKADMANAKFGKVLKLDQVLILEQLDVFSPIMPTALSLYEAMLNSAVRSMDEATLSGSIKHDIENQQVSPYLSPASREVEQFKALIGRVNVEGRDDEEIIAEIDQFITLRGYLAGLAIVKAGDAEKGLELYFSQEWRNIFGLPILSETPEADPQ